MRRFTYLYFLFSFFGVISLNGQSAYSTIDKASQSVPDSLVNYTDIANHLTADLGTSEEKIRAIYVWIAHNISYDYQQVSYPRSYDEISEIIDDVIKEKKGVCMHYANLFLAMCKEVGLESYMISGYVKQNDRIEDSSHAWNAVKIDNSYFLLDVTWGAGYGIDNKFVQKFNNEYFLISPSIFLETHMPFDPIWQFVDNPINNMDFSTADFSKLYTKGSFAFQDSIAAHLKMDELQRLQSSTERIVGLGKTNFPVKEVIDLNYSNIGILEHNLAIASFNFAVANYNKYIGHKNKRFRNPKVSDAKIRQLISNASDGLKDAEARLNRLKFNKNKQKIKKIKEGVDDNLKQLSKLLPDLERELRFVNRYLKTWKPFRIFTYGMQ